MRQTFLSGATAMLVASPLFCAHADDEARLARALSYSRDFMSKCHLLAEVSLEPREAGGPSEQFSYDRYPDVERIKLRNGSTFARKKGGKWLRSNDWGKTGTAVDGAQASKLDSQIEIAKIGWNTNHTSYDKTQGIDVTKLVSQTKDKLGEHFVFERTREHATAETYPRYAFTDYSDTNGRDLLLDKFSGPVVLGSQKLFLTVRYTALIELKNARIEISKKQSAGKP